MEVKRRAIVVTHRDTQQEHGNFVAPYAHPWAVVPIAAVPVVFLEHPESAFVEKIVGVETRVVEHRVARNDDKVRVA
jgi:hypothetical protein